jgi:hypothetical protein
MSTIQQFKQTIQVEEVPLVILTESIKIEIPLFSEHAEIVVAEEFENCHFNCNSESERFQFEIEGDHLVILKHAGKAIHTFEQGKYEVFVSPDHSVVYFDHSPSESKEVEFPDRSSFEFKDI